MGAKRTFKERCRAAWRRREELKLAQQGPQPLRMSPQERADFITETITKGSQRAIWPRGFFRQICGEENR